MVAVARNVIGAAASLMKPRYTDDGKIYQFTDVSLCFGIVRKKSYAELTAGCRKIFRGHTPMVSAATKNDGKIA